MKYDKYLVYKKETAEALKIYFEMLPREIPFSFASFVAGWNAAEQSVHLTAFGFGLAGFGLGLVIGIFLVTI